MIPVKFHKKCAAGEAAHFYLAWLSSQRQAFRAAAAQSEMAVAT